MRNSANPQGEVSPVPIPASLVRRIGAFCIDLAVLCPLLGVLAWCWTALFQIELPPSRLPLFDALIQLAGGQDPLVPGGLLLVITLIVLYFFVGPLLFGATVGLWIAGLTLADEQGHPIGAAASILRSLGTVLSAAYFWLGFLWILFDPGRQGFHDWIAGSWVIRRNAR
jgi:uncharacterized RDD family membrane protein YckC